MPAPPVELHPAPHLIPWLMGTAGCSAADIPPPATAPDLAGGATAATATSFGDENIVRLTPIEYGTMDGDVGGGATGQDGGGGLPHLPTVDGLRAYLPGLAPGSVGDMDLGGGRAGAGELDTWAEDYGLDGAGGSLGPPPAADTLQPPQPFGRAEPEFEFAPSAPMHCTRMSTGRRSEYGDDAYGEDNMGISDEDEEDGGGGGYYGYGSMYGGGEYGGGGSGQSLLLQSAGSWGVGGVGDGYPRHPSPPYYNSSLMEGVGPAAAAAGGGGFGSKRDPRSNGGGMQQLAWGMGDGMPPLLPQQQVMQQGPPGSLPLSMLASMPLQQQQHLEGPWPPPP